jgi:hypothetical protein
MRQSAKERLASKVAVRSSGCWEWTAARFDTGYGAISYKGKTRYAHRVSYSEFVGAIPNGMLVCHHCDNPACVNPQHLFLGTSADNMSDKVAKGRSVRGEKSSNSKLTELEARLIKKFLKRNPPMRGQRGGPCGFLARWFGVTQTAISLIHAGKNWGWVELHPEGRGG